VGGWEKISPAEEIKKSPSGKEKKGRGEEKIRGPLIKIYCPIYRTVVGLIRRRTR
jgi:hypothetical protein